MSGVGQVVGWVGFAILVVRCRVLLGVGVGLWSAVDLNLVAIAACGFWVCRGIGLVVCDFRDAFAWW